MMKTKWIAFLTAALFVTGGYAQPPEELPPPLPEAYEITDDFLGDPSFETPTHVPLAAPIVTPPAESPEDKAVKGITISPKAGVFPFVYDSIAYTGDERGRYFLRLQPGIGVDMNFLTDSGRLVTFSPNYKLTWDEFYNKTRAARSFTNALEATVSTKWNDLFSTSIYGDFEHGFMMGHDSGQFSSIFIEGQPSFTFKVHPSLSLTAGYDFMFLQYSEWILTGGQLDSFTEPPGDMQDVFRGTSLPGGSGFGDYYWDPSFDLFPGLAPLDIQTPSEKAFETRHRFDVSGSWTPIPGTTVSGRYWYQFADFSNNDNLEHTAHFIAPSVRQALPWEGGSVSLTDEIRLMKYKYALAVPGYTAAKQTLRNRLTLNVSQKVNDFMTFNAFYRFEITGSNSDDYSKLTYNHLMWTGVVFSF